MGDIATILAEIAASEAKGNFDAIRALRERIVTEHADSDAAVEATYKLGLDSLFRQRNLDAAVARFEAAAQAKQPYWSSAARTSLGLCYYHQKRSQKALFELRKVAYAKAPCVHSVVAVGFIESIYASEGNNKEAERVHKDRVTQLEQGVAELRSSRANASELGFFLYHLGLARQEAQNLSEARTLFEEALKLGEKALGTSLAADVQAALRG